MGTNPSPKSIKCKTSRATFGLEIKARLHYMVDKNTKLMRGIDGLIFNFFFSMFLSIDISKNRHDRWRKKQDIT